MSPEPVAVAARVWGRLGGSGGREREFEFQRQPGPKCVCVARLCVRRFCVSANARLRVWRVSGCFVTVLREAVCELLRGLCGRERGVHGPPVGVSVRACALVFASASGYF